MDPNYFHLDWERLGEVLMVIIFFSFVVERSLSLLFESNFYIKRYKGKSLKELIAFIVSVLVCYIWKFDVISIVYVSESTNFFGYLVSGGVIAGGSKASIKLFHDLMKVKSDAQGKL